MLVLGTDTTAAAGVPVAPAPVTKAEGLAVAPSSRGVFGAWLAVGPFRSATRGKKAVRGDDALTLPPVDVDESSLRPFAAATVGSKGDRTWAVVASGEGPVDLRSGLHATESDVVAYAAGTLRIGRPGRYHVLLGVDDGVRMSVDGKVVFSRDDARPELDDATKITLDLARGDHPILLKLHQRDGAWSFRFRVVDDTLAPVPDATLVLPGVPESDAPALAAKMSWISLDRGFSAAGVFPRLTVRFPEGAPKGSGVPVRVRLDRKGSDRPEFDLSLGAIGVDGDGTYGEFVASLPAFDGTSRAALDDADTTFVVSVADRTVRLGSVVRRSTREAVERAATVLPGLAALSVRPAWLHEGTVDTLLHWDRRLRTLVSRGDADGDAQTLEARELANALASLERNEDPFVARTGFVRRALVSPFDGEPSEMGVYVPPGFRPKSGRKFPLVVALHGLNGKPMAMLRWFFGGDDPKRDQEWEDRHPLEGEALTPLDAFVLAPSGLGNTMYRDMGEDDVMRAVEWMVRTYPIDESRISVTGPSMGGIGSAAVAFRYPSRFAAAAPLCGYHSYFVRADVVSHALRPWERFLAEERSNVSWAENGKNIPLFVVHGTEDKPEANSGALIETYEKLKYSIVHEHPALGHNVWQTTYEEQKAAKWLLQARAVLHPRTVTFRTARPRSASSAWAHVEGFLASDAWAEVTAKVVSRTRVEVTTRGVSALRVERDPELVEPTKAVDVRIDGTTLHFDEGESLIMHRSGSAFAKGFPPPTGTSKHGTVTGPFRDVFRDALLFVYGASDAANARVNEDVARSFANVRFGVTVKYPVMSDVEFYARGESLANDRSLFLVGSAKTNRVVRDLESAFPITVDGDAVVVGKERFRGNELGTAFVRPNPKRSDRYVAVVEGTTPFGTWRATSLPDLLPDFVVYDEDVAPARGKIVLGRASLRAAGFFTNDWELPGVLADPLAKKAKATTPIVVDGESPPP
ncbi:MAG: prolyl oligopeptidase family serine peptidase [Polyangiaceae bacterium]